MKCQRCDRDVTPQAGRCPVCQARITAVQPVTEEDETLLSGGGSEPSEEDGTLLMGSEDQAVEDDATLLLGAADSGALEDPDRTLLASGGEEALGSGPEAAARPTRGGSKLDQLGPLRPGEDFGPRYQIVKTLGLGGMGAVYQAWDKELGIMVALKVVRPEAAVDRVMARELDLRFKRELLLAREVTHKNVVRIHDLGEIEGIKYITMTFIEGEDLSGLLEREGKLSVSAALPIAREVVAGLVAAHEAGVVHRDLKPANIMISKAGNQALIMDFGVARSSGAVPAAADSARSITAADLERPEALDETMAGALVGTLEYMAPEQFKRQVADQRSDLYTFGLILYDMLLGGGRAKSAKSAIAEVQRRSESTPPAPRSVDDQIPEPLDRIICKCLASDPAERYQTTRELAEDLDRLDDEGNPLPVVRRLTGRVMITAALAVVVLLAGTWWFAKSGQPTAPPGPMSVLIADFDHAAPEAAFDGAVEQALAIGMETASFVSAYPRARARATADKLRSGSGLDVEMARLVALREGIDVILAGSIEPRGSGYQIEARVLDAALDDQASQPLATARVRAASRDEVLEAVGKLATDLLRRLGDTTPRSAQIEATETFTAASLEAMSAYAAGQDLSVQGRFEEALDAYRQSIAYDPAFGRAYAGMGTVYGNLRRHEEAEASYQKALQHLDRMTERERFRTLGTYYLLVARNYPRAIENYETLVQNYPADGSAHSNLALAYLNARNFSKAFSQGGEALELDPDNIIKRMNFAMYAMYAGDFETAMAESRKVTEQNPEFGYGQFTLARAAVANGDFEIAREAYGGLGSTEVMGSELAPLGQADLAMYQGRYRDAVDILQASLEDGGEGPVSAAEMVALAESLLILGEATEARSVALRATRTAPQESVLYPAARVLIALGDAEAPRSIGRDLENRLQSQTTAYARLLQGEVALLDGRLLEATESLRDGLQRYDTWFAHYLLGRTYFEAGLFTEAIGEFGICLDRAGEATDIFVVDAATIHYLPPIHYWLGRAWESLGSLAVSRANYKRYLELRAGADASDPFAQDARDRLGAIEGQTSAGG